MTYLRLRQICLVASDLAAREQEVGQVLGLTPCYRDPGVGKYGLHNVLYAAHGTFLEIVSPLREGTAAGRYIERRKGDGGYMFIVDCDNLEVRREKFRSLGLRIVEDLKSASDYATSEAIHLHPKDTGGCLLSVDRHSGGKDMMGGYHWAGPAWQAHAEPADVKRIVGATIQCEDPAVTARRWADILSVPVTGAKGDLRLQFDLGFAKFTDLADDRGEGLTAVHLECRRSRPILDRADALGARRGDAVCLCGVDFVLSS
jgi:hypothetical protein